MSITDINDLSDTNFNYLHITKDENKIRFYLSLLSDSEFTSERKMAMYALFKQYIDYKKPLQGTLINFRDFIRYYIKCRITNLTSEQQDELITNQLTQNKQAFYRPMQSFMDSLTENVKTYLDLVIPDWTTPRDGCLFFKILDNRSGNFKYFFTGNTFDPDEESNLKRCLQQNRETAVNTTNLNNNNSTFTFLGKRTREERDFNGIINNTSYITTTESEKMTSEMNKRAVTLYLKHT